MKRSEKEFKGFPPEFHVYYVLLMIVVVPLFLLCCGTWLEEGRSFHFILFPIVIGVALSTWINFPAKKWIQKLCGEGVVKISRRDIFRVDLNIFLPLFAIVFIAAPISHVVPPYMRDFPLIIGISFAAGYLSTSFLMWISLMFYVNLKKDRGKAVYHVRRRISWWNYEIKLSIH
ncbi:MAG: hypothetical protein ACTSYM_08640 [Candidatus Baldrarchaeia archaeon]